MTLDERLRMLAAKGELVHLSLVLHHGRWKANFAAASPANGYASAEDADPVKAIEAAIDAAPAKVKRVSTRPLKTEITAAVTTENDKP